MSLHKNRFAAATALAAALSLSAAPLAAADLPLPKTAHGYDASQDTAQNHRWSRHRHRGGIDAGDVIAGVLILGGIAAIASAASKDRRERDYRDRDYRGDYPRYPERGETSRYREYDSRSSEGGGIGNAVDMCVGEVERGSERVESVDNASRTGDGWRISGQLAGGPGFSCWIDNAGRLRDLELGDGYSGGASYERPAEDRQYDDDVYARARAAQAAPVEIRDGYAPGWENSPPPDYRADEIDEDLSG